VAQGHLVAVLTGMGLVLTWTSCAAPMVVRPAIDQGHKVDQVILDGFKRGLSTREEAVDRLGQPSSITTNAEDGTTTLAWHYVHADAKGSSAVITILKFSADDKLLFKVVSRNNQTY